MKHPRSITALLLFIFASFIIFAESEPNNTYQQANSLSLNSSDSGGLNEATQSLAADWEDWWKVTLPSDGSLYIESNSSSGLEVDLYIYDINGTTSISSGSRYGTKEYTYYTALKAGTYFIRAYRYSGTGTYTISDKFTAAPYANDYEPNDTFQKAILLNINSQTTGHIGYYQDGKTDWEDWWKISIPFDGSLNVTTESDSGEVDLYIFDINGTTSIASASTYGLTEKIKFDNLMPGTYYIRVYRYSAHGGYKITTTYTQTSISNVTTNDAEKNDNYSNSINLGSLSVAGSLSIYGHIGYYSNGYTDWEDWWNFTVGSDGKIIFNVESSSTLDFDLFLFDTNGTTSVASASTYGSKETLTFNNLGAGKYFLRIYKYAGYGSYKLTADYTVPPLANDSEPNNEITKAINITSDTKLTGHIGYYSAAATDYDDYYVLTLPTKWDSLYVRSDSDASLDVDIYLYNSSSSIIASISTYSTKEILKAANLAAGTYYIRIYKYTGQGSYAIKFSNRSISTPLTSIKKDDKINVSFPTSFILSQNYPNPFNPTTNINFALPHRIYTTLTVFDALGKVVSTIVNQELEGGQYEVQLNATNLPSGIYYYRIQTEEFVSVKKMILLK